MTTKNTTSPKTVKSFCKKHGFEILKWEKPEPNCYGSYVIDTKNKDIKNANGKITINYSLENQCVFWYKDERLEFRGRKLADLVQKLDEFFDNIKAQSEAEEEKNQYWGRIGISFSKKIPFEELEVLSASPAEATAKMIEWLTQGVAQVNGDYYFPKALEENKDLPDSLPVE